MSYSTDEWKWLRRAEARDTGHEGAALPRHIEQITVRYRDQGAGVDPEKKFALFEAFSKLGGAETFNREGMGFSLYLDRLIATYLHGDIQLDNITPHGARAMLTLPLVIKISA